MTMRKVYLSSQHYPAEEHTVVIPDLQYFQKFYKNRLHILHIAALNDEFEIGKLQAV